MDITKLDKTEHKNYPLHFQYQTDGYYDVDQDPNDLFSIKLILKPFGKVIKKEFTDHLFQDYLENPSSFALRDGNKLIGYLEVARETWHKRLRVTNILIQPEYRGQGYGSTLMHLAKKIGQEEGMRELILETQSCNVKAIDFYLKHGFTVVGIDLSAYTNQDVESKEVRLEMGCAL